MLLVFEIAWITQAYAEQGCATVGNGWFVESKASSGPLCADVLLMQSGQTEDSGEGTRKLRVFEGGKPSFESDDAALCKTCGGAMGDPFQGIEWKGHTLVVTNYGGSRE